MPKVSVVMPVYNTEKYVGEAIQSILDQTFTDFEFIIIDDGSTDKSWDIIQEYAKKDTRIIIYQNQKNKWITHTRKKLIDTVKTNYIASMDSDDISLPDRLQLCYDFLSSHPDYSVVSWNNIIIDEQWKRIGTRAYSNNIPQIILKKSPISQPSSMFRKDVYTEVWGYDPDLNYAEDYDLWCKIYSKWHGIKNIPQDLIKHRVRLWQTKSRKLKQTLKNTIMVQQRAYKEYGITPTLSDKLYWICEKLVLLLPESRVTVLFQIIEYKWKNSH